MNRCLLFQVQEQLGRAGRRVPLPALGLRRGAALRQPVEIGKVACGPPPRLQGFQLGFAPFGGGRFACGSLTLCGLWCGWIQQMWAWRELLLVPTSVCGTFLNRKKKFGRSHLFILNLFIWIEQNQWESVIKGYSFLFCFFKKIYF